MISRDGIGDGIVVGDGIDEMAVGIANDLIVYLVSLQEYRGTLHIIEEDYNIADEYLDDCEKWVNEQRSKDGEVIYYLQLTCLVALRKLSMVERASAVGKTLAQIKKETKMVGGGQ